VITLQNKTTLQIKTTTDPGRALITGLWKDVGGLKGPILLGLASRAPYFHNGSASSLVQELHVQAFLDDLAGDLVTEDHTGGSRSPTAYHVLVAAADMIL
jgi:hypothetical protein